MSSHNQRPLPVMLLKNPLRSRNRFREFLWGHRRGKYACMCAKAKGREVISQRGQADIKHKCMRVEERQRERERERERGEGEVR